MAVTTQENQAATIANTVITLTAQVYALGQTINQLSSEWTNLAVATKLNAFPTASLTATGGIGTNDGTPNTANPINVNTTPGSQIIRAVSANDLAGMLTFLQGVAGVIGGSAVSANGAAAQLIAKTL